MSPVIDPHRLIRGSEELIVGWCEWSPWPWGHAWLRITNGVTQGRLCLACGCRVAL